jgi:hypothetical protein
VSKETIKVAMLRWWKLEGKISFQVLGENLFLVEFSFVEDKKRIMDGRPWAFEGSLFLLEDFDGLSRPSSFKFDRAAFWVRMIDLPLACMNQATGRRIGESVGIVEAVDTGPDGIGWGESLRVKIVMELEKPLARGRMLKVQGKSMWIAFQYERLPRFCFNCGVIIHGKLGCPYKNKMKHQEGFTEYGYWLRAPSPTRRSERAIGRGTRNSETRHSSPPTEADPQRDRGGRTRREGRRPEPEIGRRETYDESARGRSKTRKGNSGIHGEDRAKFSETAQFESSFGKESQQRQKNDEKEVRRESRNMPNFNEDMGSTVGIIKEKFEKNIPLNAEREGCHVGMIGRENFAELGSMGLCNSGAFSPSPGSSKFSGPSIAEVAKTVQAVQRGGKNKNDEGELSGKGLVTWKRKTREGDDELSNVVVTEGIKKKKGFSGEGKSGNSEKKGRFLEVHAENKIGSGMAEAVEQPRRPL